MTAVRRYIDAGGGLTAKAREVNPYKATFARARHLETSADMCAPEHNCSAAPHGSARRGAMVPERLSGSGLCICYLYQKCRRRRCVHPPAGRWS